MDENSHNNDTNDADRYGGEETENGKAPRDQNGQDDVVGSAAMRPVFLGNLRPEFSTDKITELFTRPIPPPGASEDTFQPIAVDRVDAKRGFCFVFLKDAASQQEKEQIERFVSDINGMQLDEVSSALRVEFARGDGRVKRKEDVRRQNIQPSETLFVVNFHEETTKREDLQMLFEPYGELVRIDMKRNYAFVQFRTIDEATRALHATNGGKLDQNVLNVEYVARQRGDPDRRRRRDEPPPRGGDRRGPRPPDRMRGPPRGGPGGGGYGDRDRDRDRDRYHDEGPPPRGGGPPRDDYRPRGGGRDRSPGRAASPMGYRPRDNYRAVSPAAGYGRRSRSRSRSPPYRSSRSPPRRYDGGGRSDEYRDRRMPPPGPGGAWSPEGYRERGRSPERDVYRRDDRGYRP